MFVIFVFFDRNFRIYPYPRRVISHIRISPVNYVVKSTGLLLKKEVIQPLVPQRLPCYDFIPVTEHTFGAFLHKGWYGDFGCTKLP